MTANSHHTKAAIGPANGTAYARYDEALTELSWYGPSLANGLINHAPMAVEAMSVLGHGDRIAGWIDAQRASFAPRPTGREPLDPDQWQRALGQVDRFADWADLFSTAIDRDGWQPTLDVWTHRLSPGFVTAACHGVLRTAHAARALSDTVTRPRLQELADGLATWASKYATLPVDNLPPAGDRPLLSALASVSPVPAEHRPPEGLITEGYRSLRYAPGFPREVAAGAAAAVNLDALIAACARLFLASAQTSFGAIVFTHAVTGAAAVRNLEPLVGEQTTRALAMRAWEAGCALKAAFGAAGLEPANPEDRPPSAAPRADRLARAAVLHGDEHVIKLTEACTTAYQRHPDPVLLQTAERVRELVPA